MAIDDETGVRRKPKRRRTIPAEESSTDSSGSVALWFILSMVLIGIACLVIGCVRHGVEWRTLLSSCSSLATGIGFVAIGLLEPEWLERIIGFLNGIYSGLAQYFWATEVGSLSDYFGRRGAMVLWVVVGFPIFIWGCLVGLRIL